MSLVSAENAQPKSHEIGNRTYLIADVAPLDVDGVRTLMIGTLVWFVLFLGLLPFRGSLEASGHGWWIWTCAAGTGLGLWGWDHCRRRARKRGDSEV